MASVNPYGANAAHYPDADANRHDTRDGGVGDEEEEMYAEPCKPPNKDADEGAAVAAVAVCAITRRELHDLLKESRFGAEVGAYNAYFKADPSGDGGHVCRVCTLPIGAHGDGSSGAAAAAAGGDAAATKEGEESALPKMPPMNMHLDEVAASGVLRIGSAQSAGTSWLHGRTMSSYMVAPLHFSKTAWFARFLEFDAYEEEKTDVTGTGDKRQVVHTAKIRWRCGVQDSHGHECGAKFSSRGISFASTATEENEEKAKQSINIASFSVLHADELAIAKHFNDAHLIEHVPAGRWTTSLFGCCGDPKACCSCIVFPCGAPCCCHNGYGFGFADAIDRVIPAHPQLQDHQGEGEPEFGTMIPFTKWDEYQCSKNCVTCAWVPIAALPLLGHLTIVGLIYGFGSVITLCGFPCNSDAFAPMLCGDCYFRRRRMVHALDADEGRCATRAAVVFCTPCSEVQLWRELRNSGVWPGLACCTASEADRAAMAPSAVRARYAGADGAYGVRAQAGAGHAAELLAASVQARKGPALMYRIE